MISFLAFSYAQIGLQHFSSNYHIDRSDFMVINPKVGAADMALAVVNIAVSFSVSPKWLRLLTGFKQQEKIQVKYFDPENCGMKQAEM